MAGVSGGWLREPLGFGLGVKGAEVSPNHKDPNMLRTVDYIIKS